jgi:hypothetical protein
MVRPSMDFEMQYRELIAGSMHGNQDQISQGPRVPESYLSMEIVIFE